MEEEDDSKASETRKLLQNVSSTKIGVKCWRMNIEGNWVLRVFSHSMFMLEEPFEGVFCVDACCAPAVSLFLLRDISW